MAGGGGAGREAEAGEMHGWDGPVRASRAYFDHNGRGQVVVRDAYVDIDKVVVQEVRGGRDPSLHTHTHPHSLLLPLPPRVPSPCQGARTIASLNAQ